MNIDGYGPYAGRKPQIKATLERTNSKKKLPLNFEK